MLLKTLESHAIALVTTMMQEYYALDGLDFDAEAARQAVQTLLEQPDYGQVYLIQQADQTVGYVVLTYWFSLEFRGRSAFIDEIYLRSDFRGQGLGSEIIATLAEQCRAQGIRTLRLEVEDENTRAQAVYRKNGFQAHPRVLMTKWL